MLISLVRTNTMPEINLYEIHDVLVSTAKNAGEMILSANPTTASSGSKKNCAFASHLPQGLTITNPLSVTITDPLSAS